MPFNVKFPLSRIVTHVTRKWFFSSVSENVASGWSGTFRYNWTIRTPPLIGSQMNWFILQQIWGWLLTLNISKLSTTGYIVIYLFIHRPCLFRSWSFKLSDRLHEKSQYVHAKGLAFEWIRMCFFKFVEELISLKQIGQLRWLGSKWIGSICKGFEERTWISKQSQTILFSMEWMQM